MSAAAAADKAAALLPLHTGAGFVLPNAWDEGSARILDQVGQTIAAAVSVGVVGALPARSPHR